MRYAYDMLLRLYPDAFRRRYGVEMSLDFADGWNEATARGRTAALAFASRAGGDLVVSLLREWTRGSRVVIGATAAAVTLLLWGLALQPWRWNWDIQPGPRHPGPVADVTAGQLLALAAAAMIPVILVLLFATRMVQRREPHRRRL